VVESKSAGSGSSTTRWRPHLLNLAAYALLAVLLTWPTVTHLASALPGDGGDDPAIAWNLWWVKHALLTLHANPLITTTMFYPIGINLAFYTLTLLNALTALPLTLNLGVVAASNLHTLLTMVIGAYGMALLARQQLSAWRGRPAIWPAALAGIFYAFASSQLFYVSLGQFNIASTHWIPYTLLFVFKARRDPRSLRWPALAGLFLVMQTYAEMTYASFLLIFIALVVAYEAAWGVVTTHYAIRNTVLHLRNLLLLLLLFLIGISPLLVTMAPDMLAEGDFWVQGSGFAESFSADLLGFLVPTMHHPLLGGLVTHTGITAYDKGQHLYLGAALLILAIVGLVRRPRRWRWAGFWLAAAVLFGWLALGPTLHVNGSDTGLPGPYVLLQSLPVFKGNRYPSRYSVLLILALAMLAARGLQSLWPGGPAPLRSSARLRAAGGIAGLVALSMFEQLSVPLPQSDMSVPAAYSALAAAPPSEAGTLLDIPIAWRNGFRITGPLDPGFMFGQFYQIVHGRPLLQGNTSRNPEFKFQYFTQAPILNSLLALETGHPLPPGRISADRAVAADVLRFFDVRTIVVRRGPGNNPGAVPEATIPYIEQVLPVERTYADDLMSVYRVSLPPLPQSVQLSPKEPLIRLELGEGWGPLPERYDGEPLMWAQRKSVRLLVVLNGRPQQVSWRLYSPAAGQRLTFSMNGWQSAPLDLSLGWGEYALDLPAAAVRAGLNEIWLGFDRLLPAAGLPHPAEGQRPASLVVCSAGEEVGSFGHIYVDGVDRSPNRRGYNVAVISPEGSVQAMSFDTHLDPGASAALAAFIQRAPAGSTVAVAVADEASMNLGREATAALGSAGAAGDLTGKFRWSHALIGTKGDQPGAALETMDALRPVCVAAGPALSEPNAAAGLAWMRFEGK